MTERFNRLDINQFSGGLPIRSAPHQQQQQQRQRMPRAPVVLPVSTSVRDAYEGVYDGEEQQGVVVGDVVGENGVVDEDGDEEEEESGDERQGRVHDVGDML